MIKKTYGCELCSEMGFESPQALGAHKRKVHPGQPKNQNGNKSRLKKKRGRLRKAVAGVDYPTGSGTADLAAMRQANHKPLSLQDAIEALLVKRDAMTEVILTLRGLMEAHDV